MFVFVYGTLKQGFKHHALYMREAEFISEGTIKGFEMFDTGCGYPTIVADPMQEGIVHGEMYRATYDMMDELEFLEGVEIDLFKRVATVVTLEDGKLYRAWLYICGSALEANAAKFMKVESGNWMGPVKREVVQ